MSEPQHKNILGGLDPTDIRKKRQDASLSLRKSKREEQLAKRRNAAFAASSSAVPGAASPSGSEPFPASVPSASAAPSGVPDTDPAITPVLAKQNVQGWDTFTSMGEVRDALCGADETRKLQACVHVRRILSLDRNPPIDSVLNANCLPPLVACLGCEGNPKLQFEAAWALTNIASGESRHTRSLVQGGAVGPLLALLSSRWWEICEQSVWALGNIAGDGAECRDFLLASGAMQAVVSMITPLVGAKVPATLMHNSAWTFSNLFRGKPAPPLEAVQSGFPLLLRLLQHPDSEVVIDCLWAVSYATENSDKSAAASGEARLRAIRDSGILEAIIPHLRSTELAKVLPSVRTVGNVVVCSTEFTDYVIQRNIIPALIACMGHNHRTIRKEVLWVLSNIAAGTQEHVNILIQNNVPELAYNVLNNLELELRKEAAWIIANMAICGSHVQIQTLVSTQHLLESLVLILNIYDTRLLEVTLSAIRTVFEIGATSGNINAYTTAFQNLGGEERLDDLQDHPSETIYDLAHDLIVDFFGDDIDDTDDMDGGATDQAAQPQFNFQFNGFNQTGGFNSTQPQQPQQPTGNMFSFGGNPQA